MDKAEECSGIVPEQCRSRQHKAADIQALNTRLFHDLVLTECQPATSIFVDLDMGHTCRTVFGTPQLRKVELVKTVQAELDLYEWLVCAIGGQVSPDKGKWKLDNSNADLWVRTREGRKKERGMTTSWHDI
eukprot:2751015-Ditylum_brightwellii.AAC.2